MSGILERIEAKLDQLLTQSGPPGLAQVLAQQPQALAQQPQAQPLAQQANLLGGAPAGAQTPPAGQYPPATQEMIVALVTPLVNDPNTKAALQAEMHAMGVAALPDAQPHQYPELYHRFQQVQLRQQAAQAQVQQPAASPASII
jgi:hypothetical protein